MIVGWDRARARGVLSSTHGVLRLGLWASLLFGLAAGANPAPTEAVQAAFDIQEIRVLGNTVLDARSVEGAVYPFLGPKRTIADLEAARAALETRYHDQGYGTVFVDIPEQTVDDGIVRLHVTEGKLASANVTGAQYFSERQIRNAIPAATAGAVPSLTELQAQIANVNAVTPDRAVQPVLKPGPTPGTVDLALNVEDHLPFHGSVELNNQDTIGSKPLRLATYLSYDNLFGRQDSASVQYLTSPQRTQDVRVFAAGYVMRAGDGKLSFSYINNSSDVPIAAADSIGKGRVYGVHYDEPLVAVPGQTQDLIVGFEYKRTIQITGAPAGSLGGSGGDLTAPLSYSTASLQYNGLLSNEAHTYTWSVGPVVGLRGVGSEPQQFDNKRYLARGNFFALRGDASWTERIGHGFEWVVRGAGQWADEPLVPNEQFVIGGVGSVRGYYEAEELGDFGLRGTVEVHAPSLFGSYPSVSFMPLIYADAGKVGFRDALPGTPTSVFLSSAGAGFQALVLHHLSADLTWAHPFKSGTNVGSRTVAGESRWLFSVKTSW